VRHSAEEGGRPGAGRLAAHGALFALWLSAAFALGGYVSGDRYPGYYLAFTCLLLAAGLVVPLALLGALARVHAAGALASAYGILFAAGLSLDVNPELRVATPLGAARLLLFGLSVLLAAWNLRRGRSSRLSLGAALALLALAWCLCGALRTAALPQTLARPAILLPLVVALALLVPGLPRLDPVLSGFRLLATVAAGAVLVLLPLVPRVPRPERLAAASAKTPPTQRSALLIVLDTLRRDHMSLYGYQRKTTPRLDERARAAVVYDESTSVAAFTLASHASIFTGLWPRSHGAHAFEAEAEQRGDGQSFKLYPLAAERVTLAEIAREHGYRTAGISSNSGFMTARWGMDQGFEEYLSRRPRFAGLQLSKARDCAWRWDARRAQYLEMPYFTAPEMTQAAIAWLERRGDRPFFLFLNYMDVHLPNAAPGSQGIPFEGETVRMGAEASALEKRYLAGADMTPGEQAGVVNEYDRELIHLDRGLDALLEYLESSGLAARTLVIVTSDHGEFLGEHHLLGHGKDLFTEMVDVPLIVWEPGAAPGRVTRPVQGPDLFPTILRYLGLPIPEGTQGQPLHEADHPIISEQYNEWSASRGRDQHAERIVRTIREGEHRYFQISGGEEKLFDLRSDPGEANDLIARRPEVAAAARARLEAWLLRTPEAARPKERPRLNDPEALENLRALGYIQ
jgi:arylsulfatase A-like enzyme